MPYTPPSGLRIVRRHHTKLRPPRFSVPSTESQTMLAGNEALSPPPDIT